MPSLSNNLTIVIFFLSGVAGLGYEILWTRMLSAGLGHEIVSVLAVVSAFFSGLALGAWCLDRPVSLSLSPARWYAQLEVVMGLWALALIWILPQLNHWVSTLIGTEPSAMRHWVISFAYPFLVLLPATFAMGGTLPAVDRFLERLNNDRQAVAGLYGINTLGAVGGTFLVTFMLLPAFGMQTTSILLAALNFAGAAGFFFLSQTTTAVMQPSAQPAKTSHLGSRRLFIILFVTGILGIGFEVAMVRVLSQILEDTVFSFASMLMVFLFGTAVGAVIYHKWKTGQKWKTGLHFHSVLSFLLLSTSVLSLLSVTMLRFASPLFHQLQQHFGDGFRGAVTAELSIALIFFLLPTTSMGATFCHMAQGVKRPNGGVGQALCLNTVGGAVAPILFGVILLPLIGLHFTLLLIPVGYMLCITKLKRGFAATATLLTATVLYLALNANPHQFLILDKGDTVVSHREGVMASVSVIQDRRDGRHLKVNNHYQMGGTTSVFSDRRQAYLPLLLHPNPQKALFLGLGTGTTFAAATDFRGLEAVGVELIPEVIEAMKHFKKVTGDLNQKETLRIVQADARRYVTATDQRFDVVVADLFHPARDGAGSLYTEEHFLAIRDTLSDSGLFCQWLPLYQMDTDLFKVIVKTFLEVFPRGQAYLAHYSIDQPIIGLVGAKQDLRFPEKWYRKRVPDQKARRYMAGFGYDSIYSLLGTFLAGDEVLRKFTEGSRVNTDRNPIVLFRAPQFVYGRPEPSHQRLVALLTTFSDPDPESILSEVGTEEDRMARSRLSAYWKARDTFLKLGTVVERTQDVNQLYANASQPLLDVVRKSMDFSAAYFPLISIAYDIFPHDRDASYKLLRDLERANPMRAEAGILRQKLFVH